jgi:SH3-like domain-containing protein
MLMGMGVTPHNFAKVAANSCCVKGNPKKRCSIVAEPDKKATLVKKVPGGMRLELLDEEGKWFRVKLKDGTGGWIQKKDLLMN